MSSDVLSKIVVILHNISSVHRLVELVRLATGFGIRNIVLTKVTGAAAQQGLPEVFRIGLKFNSNIIVLSELNDVVELLNPLRLLFLTCETGQLTLQDLMNEIRSSEVKVGLVVNGSDLPFLPRELQLGKSVRVTRNQIPSTGILAIALHKVLEEPS